MSGRRANCHYRLSRSPGANSRAWAGCARGLVPGPGDLARGEHLPNLLQCRRVLDRRQVAWITAFGECLDRAPQ